MSEILAVRGVNIRHDDAGYIPKRLRHATRAAAPTRAQVEQLRELEQAARAVMEAVNGTHDHTQWFTPLARLNSVLALLEGEEK
jgi:hypothetical protein